MHREHNIVELGLSLQDYAKNIYYSFIFINILFLKFCRKIILFIQILTLFTEKKKYI